MPQFQFGTAIERPVDHGPLVVIGLLGSGKSKLLRERYSTLICSGIPAEKVVVWVANRDQGGVWRKYIDQFDFPHGETRISTFRSWVRRELEMNWPLVESSHFLPGDPKVPEPFFMGLAAAQQVLREVIGPLGKRYPALDRCRTPSFLQLIQVLDTYGRLVENSIPPDAEQVVRRLDSGHRMNSDSPEIHRFIGEAIATYRSFCFAHRLLDYNAQFELFHRVLWANQDYRERLQQEIAYLFVDNCEETFPLAQEVIAALCQSCRGVVLARDSNGGLREYLGGDPRGADELIQTIPEVQRYHLERPVLVSPEMATFADSLAQAVRQSPDAEPPLPVPAVQVHVHAPYNLRLQMFKAIEQRLFELLDSGVSPGQIVVIAPTVDQLLVHHLQKELAKRHQLLRVLTGSQRVIDHRPVRILLTFARLARPNWQEPPSQQDVVEALECLLDLHPLESTRLTRLVFDRVTLMEPAAVVWESQTQGLKEAYLSLYEWLEQVRTADMDLDRLLEEAFANLYAPRRLRNLAPDAPPPAGDMTMDDPLDILQIEHLIESAQGYRRLAAAMGIASGDMARRFLQSINAGELAATPIVPHGSLTETVSLFTAAKYAELGPPVKNQLWVDASSPHWFRSSIREFMNPLLFSRHWPGGDFTAEHDRRHQVEILARVLQTVILKATGTIDVFRSDYGSDGAELAGELAYLLEELTACPPGGGR